MILKQCRYFDGYLHMECDNETYRNERRDGAVEGDEEKTEKEDVLIGTKKDRERLLY